MQLHCIVHAANARNADAALSTSKEHYFKYFELLESVSSEGTAGRGRFKSGGGGRLLCC